MQRYPYLDNDMDFTRPDSTGSGGYINYIGGGYHSPESLTTAPQFAGISRFPTITFGSGTVTVGSNGEYCLYSDPTGYSTVICYLAANTMDGGALPFLSFCDIHYQSTGIGTKNKAPNFYVP